MVLSVRFIVTLFAAGQQGEGHSGGPLGQFPSGNLSECLPQALRLNGHKDSPNGADERHCGKSV